MSLRRFIKSKIPKSILNFLREIKKSLSSSKLSSIEKFEYKGEKKIKDDIYGKYIIEGNEPARETIAVKTLPMSVNVEISMIAIL